MNLRELPDCRIGVDETLILWVWEGCALYGYAAWGGDGENEAYWRRIPDDLVRRYLWDEVWLTDLPYILVRPQVEACHEG